MIVLQVIMEDGYDVHSHPFDIPLQKNAAVERTATLDPFNFGCPSIVPVCRCMSNKYDAWFPSHVAVLRRVRFACNSIARTGVICFLSRYRGRLERKSACSSLANIRVICSISTASERGSSGIDVSRRLVGASAD